jgi:PAS domain S-box-containing protein
MYTGFFMKRDASGKFTSNWDCEAKQRVCVSLTSTAWQLLEAEAQKLHISRSELIERYARQLRAETSPIQPEVEETRRQRETELQLITNTLPVLISFIDSEQRYRFNNQQYEAWLGKPLTEVYGKYLWEVLGQSAYEAIRPYVEQVLTGKPVTYETQASYQNGQTRYIHGTYIPRFDEQGNVEGFVALINDITEQQAALRDRQQAEAALQQSEEKFRQLANAMPQIVWILNANGGLEYVNQQWYDYSGLIPDHAHHQEMSSLVIHPDDAPSTHQQWMASLAAGTPYEKECRLRRASDGTYRWFLVRTVPIKNEQGQIIQWYGTSTDIDDHKRNEEAQHYLAEASKVLSSSLDYQTTLVSVAQITVPHLADWCIVYVIEEDGSIQQLATAHVDPDKVKWAWEMKDKYPVTGKEERGAGFTLRTGKSDLIPEIPDALLVNAAHDPEHLEILREIGFKAVMTVPMRIQDRTLGAISFVSTDESGRHYDQVDLSLAEELGRRAALAVDNARLYQVAQRERARAEAANRIKDEFLAVLSHELRTPLNPILGWAQLLKNRQYDEKTIARAIEIIERNAKLQSQLIEDLLDVSRILQGKLQLEFQPVDLKFVIESAIETVRLAAEAKSIQIHTQLDSQIGQVTGNSARLQQVVWNLLSNAIKFTPQGKRVEITLQRVDNYAQLKVSDTGIGIEPEFLPYVFDYFRQADSKTTRKFGGLGLGLAIVRHLVELHGGTVWAESLGEGQGASFTLQIPLLVKMPKSKKPTRQATPKASLQGIQVLVVDDERDMREFLTFVLEEAGAEVMVATSAMEALEVLQKSTPNLLLSDIGMPEMDGYALIRQVRDWGTEVVKGVSAIALTAYAGEFNEQQALAAGFQAHLSKPIEPEKLVQAISNLIRNHCRS